MPRRSWMSALGGLAMVLAACSSGETSAAQDDPLPTAVDRTARSDGQALQAIPSMQPSAAPPATLTLFPTATLDDPEWENRTPGIERREIIVAEPLNATRVRLHMVRVDPALMDIKVHYEPGEANSISGWQSETGAMVVVNGGFFDGEFNTEGVTFVDGEEFGISPGYEDKIGLGGFFGIKDGAVSITPLGRRADPPGTHDFDYATQAYPMLLMPGGVSSYDEETGHAAERTIVAIDGQGRVTFIIIRTAIFTLFGLSRTLAEVNAEHDLGFEIALNLDGGKSSGMEIWAGREHTHWNSTSALPIIIAVYPKEGVPVVPQANIPPALE